MQIVKKFILGVICLAALSLSITSCSEEEAAGEYDNWEVRNLAYIDSIAQLCDANADGNWVKYSAFNLNDSIEKLSPNKIHYVYCHKIENGTGTYHPIFNDSVRVHYFGSLIPTPEHNSIYNIAGVNYSIGYVFGKSYSTYSLNEATDVPSLMAVSENIDGFATALMHMVEGDRWMLYIPYYLGYDDSESSSSIPAYSTLVFDVKLAKIYKYGIETNTTWR